MMWNIGQYVVFTEIDKNRVESLRERTDKPPTAERRQRKWLDKG